MGSAAVSTRSTDAEILVGTARTDARTRLAALATVSTGERALKLALVLAWLAVAGGALAFGLPYYLLPLAARPESPLHELLKPSGLVGQGYGVVGTGLITLGVGMYSIRKRVGVLSRLGQLHHWLQVHVFLCTLGPFLVLLHTSFKFGGLVSIAFWSMAAVATSGLFGRYVYAHIPRALHGQGVSLESLRRAKADLVERLVRDYRGDAAALRDLVLVGRGRAPRGLLHALALAVRYDLTKRSRVRRLKRRLHATQIPPFLQQDVVLVVQAQITMEQQIALLKPFQRMFHYWHVFHLPLTAVMFAVLAVHVGVAVMFGYTWIF